MDAEMVSANLQNEITLALRQRLDYIMFSTVTMFAALDLEVTDLAMTFLHELIERHD